MSNTLAMILAGGVSRELPVLTSLRSNAALPYGGRYRVIDFCLSNCANSGIQNVGILAQYNPGSLIAHIGNGNPWDLNRRKGGVVILQPYVARSKSNWFRGTADALRQHVETIKDMPCDDVLVLSGDQVYKMDYRSLAAFHRAGGYPVTIAVKHCENDPLGRYGGLDIDRDAVVKDFVEKPEGRTLGFFSLGIYIFKKPVLMELLSTLDEAKHDIVFDVLIPMVNKREVRAYVFDGYWADVGWLQNYYDASMVLIDKPSALNLNDRRWPISSKTEIRSPSYLSKTSVVTSCLVANGCHVEGQVRRSILFPGVKVGSGALVEDSILFADVVVEDSATVTACIIDKKAVVGSGAAIGYGNSTCANSAFPDVLDSGLTVIGIQTAIPGGMRIGRNCLIGSDLKPEAIPRRDIVCGETITSDSQWQRTWS